MAICRKSEYDQPRRPGLLELRISKLETCLQCQGYDESKIDTERVQILNRVKLKNLKTNAVVEYMLVSESEANLRENKISIATPIAKALIGKKIGDIVEVQVPSGLMKFEILSISL